MYEERGVYRTEVNVGQDTSMKTQFGRKATYNAVVTSGRAWMDVEWVPVMIRIQMKGTRWILAVEVCMMPGACTLLGNTCPWQGFLVDAKKN
ncbi:hypothetical protein BDN67DRAFT_971512 [Paxillus ammoniavirescens]|nr:hypothetical protein BDN67DRAFT_971512 [Paxillus ammoniavirescens]